MVKNSHYVEFVGNCGVRKFLGIPDSRVIVDQGNGRFSCFDMQDYAEPKDLKTSLEKGLGKKVESVITGNKTRTIAEGENVYRIGDTSGDIASSLTEPRWVKKLAITEAMISKSGMSVKDIVDIKSSVDSISCLFDNGKVMISSRLKEIEIARRISETTPSMQCFDNFVVYQAPLLDGEYPTGIITTDRFTLSLLKRMSLTTEDILFLYKNNKVVSLVTLMSDKDSHSFFSLPGNRMIQSNGPEDIAVENLDDNTYSMVRRKYEYDSYDPSYPEKFSSEITGTVVSPSRERAKRFYIQDSTGYMLTEKGKLFSIYGEYSTRIKKMEFDLVEVVSNEPIADAVFISPHQFNRILIFTTESGALGRVFCPL